MRPMSWDVLPGIAISVPQNDSKLTLSAEELLENPAALEEKPRRIGDFQQDVRLDMDDAPMRAHVSRSMKKGHLDIFVRELSSAELVTHVDKFPFHLAHGNYCCGYRPDLGKGGDFSDVKFFTPPHLLPEICVKYLEDYLDKGLIVICGETGCGKSVFVRQLIVEVLEHKAESRLKENAKAKENGDPKDKECLHLITFEDPVEASFYAQYNEEAFKAGTREKLSFAYETLPHDMVYVQATHRERGSECRNTRDFFSSALRQKPALALVGETRDKEEWDDIVDYAMTGHLAVTTCHAGSVKECLSKILLATAATKNPAKRSFVATALVAIIHLQSIKATNSSGGPVKIILPSMYIFNNAGTARMIADNLDSVLPGFEPPSMGYQHFLQLLEDKVKAIWPEDKVDALLQPVRKIALSLDFGGRI